MRLHLLTAVTRPDNLPRMSASIDAAAHAGADLVWHLREDVARTAVGGQALKNAMIDGIWDGWLTILDDDNLLHPEMPARCRALLDAHPGLCLIVVGQSLPGNGYRPAALGCLRVDGVDAAQLIIRRAALGALRLAETYAGDGILAQMLAEQLEPAQIAYINEPLSYYNRLSWGDL